jgi:hydroxymethylbilane synthase
MNPLRIGTRCSPLALWQANHVADLLRPLAAPRPVELVLIETEGDRVRDRALSQIGGDGLFTKEIQNAVLEDRADIAVHSLKDLPTHFVEGLMLGAVPPRGPIGDAFVSSKHECCADLPRGARVGTSSLRRRSQLLNQRPDLRVETLRGNVEGRLRKLDEQGFDAIILAEAGLRRLGLEAHITEILDRTWMLPAVGQGALGLECRTADDTTRALLAHLDDAATRAAVLSERAFLRKLGGGCLVPIGALAEVTGDRLTLSGAVLNVDGTASVTGTLGGKADDPEGVGHALADELIGRGAGELLRR